MSLFIQWPAGICLIIRTCSTLKTSAHFVRHEFGMGYARRREASTQSLAVDELLDDANSDLPPTTQPDRSIDVTAPQRRVMLYAPRATRTTIPI
jgi:hypothetical protein